MNLDRRKILNDLIKVNGSLLEMKERLSQLDWDSNDLEVVLKKNHLVNVLNKYVNDELSVSDLELWANMVESREDISIDLHQSKLIEKIIFVLANPYMEGSVNKESVKGFLEELKKG